MPVDRDAVRDAAKYLRQVRPIDPAEVAEYVPEQPDPRVVRQVLREEAPALGLAETADGTFRPAAEGPLTVPQEAFTGLPSGVETRLLDRLVERYGPNWAEGDTGAAIRERIARLKAEYFAGRGVTYDADVTLAYAIYHLAGYYASTRHLLTWLSREGLLPTRARVLDVGAGVGGPALAFAAVYGGAGTDPPPILDYHAVEPADAAADLFETLVDPPRNVRTTVHREPAETVDPPGTFDLVLFSNVLSELSDPVETVDRLRDQLAADGTLLLTAPADRNTSLQLRAVERALEDRGMTVYGPTVRLWSGERPTAACWSFDQGPDLDVPAPQAALAAEADDPDAVRNTSVKYSYSVLRTDGQRRNDLALDRSNVAKLGAIEDAVGERVDLVAAKLSRNLADDGHPLYRISDGSESTEPFAVLVNETALNEDLARAAYGGLLQFTNVLVLYNDDEDAYNLVVDEETIVDAA
jgi:SAM-dependent methyltransferase